MERVQGVCTTFYVDLQFLKQLHSHTKSAVCLFHVSIPSSSHNVIA